MKKCQRHGIRYSIGKDYMSQPYLYCKKCRKEIQRIEEVEKRLAELEILHPRKQ
jgi:hypothetical protein